MSNSLRAVQYGTQSALLLLSGSHKPVRESVCEAMSLLLEHWGYCLTVINVGWLSHTLHSFFTVLCLTFSFQSHQNN